MNADIPFMVAVKRSGRPFNKKDQSVFSGSQRCLVNDRKPAVASPPDSARHRAGGYASDSRCAICLAAGALAFFVENSATRFVP